MLKSELAALARRAGIDVGSLTKDQLIERLTRQSRKPEAKAESGSGKAKPPATSRTTREATTVAAKKTRDEGPPKGEKGKAKPEREPEAPAAAAEPPPAALEGQPEQPPENGRAPSDQTQAIRSKYEVGPAEPHELLDLDRGLPELPEGYAGNRVVLLPRDPKWLYAYWDITNEHKDAARRQGGRSLALRLYDVTDLVFDGANAHAMWEQDAHELARNWYLHVPAAGRHYCLEVGYRGAHGEWFLLARSNMVGVPADRPSGRVHDVFVTIPFDRPLPAAGAPRPAAPAVAPGAPTPETPPALHEAMYQAGGGVAAGPGASLGMSGGLARQAPPWSGAWSGGWSGLMGSAALPTSPSGAPQPEQARQFWFRADAELIIYGATEPDATVTSGGRPVPLRPDGTFYLRMHFPDGVHDFPLEATAADGEQKRAIRLTFQRRTE
ncbi:MAG TPA: DUF4912 domain-containing protein [Polyangia bacterium]